MVGNGQTYAEKSQHNAFKFLSVLIIFKSMETDVDLHTSNSKEIITWFYTFKCISSATNRDTPFQNKVIGNIF